MLASGSPVAGGPLPSKGESAEVVAPDQPATIDLGDGRPRDVRLQSQLTAPSGQANGQQPFFAGKLKVTGDQLLVEVTFDRTELVRTPDGPVATFAGDGRHCGPDGCETGRFTGSVQPEGSTADDCLI